MWQRLFPSEEKPHHIARAFVASTSNLTVSKVIIII